ncbi:MAG: GNAT family N-acetyltransferase [Prosthecobacter sp.]
MIEHCRKAEVRLPKWPPFDADHLHSHARCPAAAQVAADGAFCWFARAQDAGAATEIGVASEQQGKGIGKQLMQAMFAHGRSLGCGEAWVLTGHDNAVARGLYAAVGGKEQAALLVSFRLQPQLPV